MSDSDFTKFNNIDLEVELNKNKQEILSIQIPTSTPTPTPTSNLISNNSLGSLLWIFIMFISFPFTFCDLYYGYNDNSCVSKPAGRLAINLKDYLLICGWLDVCILTIMTIGLCFTDINSISKIKNRLTICYIFLLILMAIIGLFSFMLNIFGAVIFWSLMDTSECDSGIYNYVFASLIFKLCLNTFNILKGKNDNK